MCQVASSPPAPLLSDGFGSRPSSRKLQQERPNGSKRERLGSPPASRGDKHSDGRLMTSPSGAELCNLWNFDYSVCQGPMCKYNRTHLCQWCLSSDHKAADCPQRPSGWRPPPDKAKGGAKREPFVKRERDDASGRKGGRGGKSGR